MTARKTRRLGRWRKIAFLLGLISGGPLAPCPLAPCAVAHAAEPAEPPCVAAARFAERQYSLPPGLLLAIGRVESGRVVPASDGGTGRRDPWPWSVDAEAKSLFFQTRQAAIAWVRGVQAQGQDSIDVGCFQINLHFHPAAFASLEEAFDPARNADYAARFLLALQARLGDWGRAAGAYHSQTESLALPYRRLVALAIAAPPRPDQIPDPTPDSTMGLLRSAWQATLGTPSLGTPSLGTPSLGTPTPAAAVRRQPRSGLPSVPPSGLPSGTAATRPNAAMLAFLPVRTASLRDMVWKER